MNRRTFLSKLTVLIGATFAGVLAVPVIGYFLSPLFVSPPDDFVDVGGVGDFPVGSTRAAKFADPGSVPWAGKTADTAVWVRRLAQSGNAAFRVFAENCTHLGCPVEWRESPRMFFCPCHGGAFYQDGTVAAGPPQIPLFDREWKVEGNRLLVRGRILPSIRRAG